MLEFTKLRWRNFLSTGNNFTEIELNKSQNTLVVGVNGSGKSTMLDALCFALFNTPFRNIGKPILVNSINLKGLSVEVEFHSENHEYKIIRGIKPTVFEIYRDGTLINQEAESKDYQDYLEKFILKLNYKSFTQIVILGSASFTPFMQLAAQDRRAVIEDLLDIQIFSLMNKLAKTKLSSLMTERVVNKALIDATVEKITTQERYIIEVQQDAEALANSYRTERDHNTQELNRLAREIIVHGQAIMDLNLTITDKKKVLASSKKATQLEAQLEALMSKHKKTIKFYETEENCPTCMQVIDTHFTEKQLQELGEKVNECQVGMKEMEKRFLDAQNRLEEIEGIEREISNHELEVAQYLTSTKEIEKFNAKIDAKLVTLKSSHQSTEREQSRLLDHQQELNRLEVSRKDLIELSTYYDAAGALLKDTGIKTKIIRQYLPIINTLANKYLGIMDFFVNFNLDETFKETIKSRHRDEFTYHSFSEGEKQRIDMALMLTWRAVAKLKNSADTNILILDEVFDSSLDNAGTEELMKILHALDATNVFVISHRGDLLQDKFRSVIRFQTQQCFSRIVP